jgi:hypothetical protein
MIGYRMQDGRYKMLDTGYRMFEIQDCWLPIEHFLFLPGGFLTLTFDDSFRQH